eukprot:265597-Chlamydomonas_euryale.AAC.1
MCTSVTSKRSRVCVYVRTFLPAADPVQRGRPAERRRACGAAGAAGPAGAGDAVCDGACCETWCVTCVM